MKLRDIIQVLVIPLGLTAAVIGCQKVSSLDQVVTLDIRDSEFDQQVGGASMLDVVETLREKLLLPISFEEIDFGKSIAFLSMSDALKSLRELKEKRQLSPREAKRLDELEGELLIMEKLKKLKTIKQLDSDQRAFSERYRALADEPVPDKRLFAVRKRTFKVNEAGLTIEQLLNHIIALDPDYQLQQINSARRKPVLVIKPDAKHSSALAWAVPAYCEGTQTLRELFAPGGYLAEQMAKNKFERKAAKVKVASPDDNSALPRVPLDLCKQDMTAESVLNAAVAAAGWGYYWTVSTNLKGARDYSIEHQP